MSDCTLSTVDTLNEGSMVQRQIERGYFKEVKAINTVKDSSTIEFAVTGDGEEFTDLRNTFLKVSLCIRKSNGSALAADDNISVINYIASTFFSQVTVYLNEEEISNSSASYAYRAILESLLTFDEAALTSQFQSGGYYKDTAGLMDVVDLTASPTNEGLKERAELFSESKVVEFMTRIHSDIFAQPKLLVNGIRMRLVLNFNKNNFCLMGNNVDDYKLKIVDASLMIRKCKLVDSVYLNAISKKSLYPITRVALKEFSFTSGSANVDLNNLKSGVLPNRIVLAMVSNAAKNGNGTLNPFNFQHFNLSECNVMLTSGGNNGTVNGQPLRFNFDDGQDVDGYWTLFAGTGKMHDNAGSIIKRKDYKSGYTLIAIDLSPTLCSGDYIDPAQSGELSVSLVFRQTLAVSITVFAYLEYDGLLEITKEKVVIPHFHV